jgi:hypothetical protein
MAGLITVWQASKKRYQSDFRGAEKFRWLGLTTANLLIWTYLDVFGWAIAAFLTVCQDAKSGNILGLSTKPLTIPNATQTKSL